MTLSRGVSRALPFAATLSLLVATPAFAQWSGVSNGNGARPLFEWNGEVDREVQITMRGADAWTRDFGNDQMRRHNSRVESALPRQMGDVQVRLIQGRGDVEVVQQPTPNNDFTTVVRIRDPQSGAARYRVEAYWQPAYNGGNGNRRGRRADGDGDADDRGYNQGDQGGYRRAPYGVYDGVDPRREPAGGVNGGVDPRRNPNGSMWPASGEASALRWSGYVDDQLEIRVQRDRVDYRTLSGSPPRGIQSNVGGYGLPRRDAMVRVNTVEGRGQVYVVEQPTARNGYTAVIRVYDPQGGYGHYTFDLNWY